MKQAAMQSDIQLSANSVRVHFYLGPVVRSEIVNKINAKTAKEDLDHFTKTRVQILKLFGLLLDGRDRKDAEKYTLKHIDGGVITSTK